ncbi:hypothetical protein, partial [Kosakonia sp. S42]|uniref:hypothetical protein n=1 Tax=Kosakonia sp. S42 TaxID=2767458 RepID=UPI001F305922
DTNKRDVLHDGLLHKETSCQRTAHRMVGTISLTSVLAGYTNKITVRKTTSGAIILHLCVYFKPSHL